MSEIARAKRLSQGNLPVSKRSKNLQLVENEDLHLVFESKDLELKSKEVLIATPPTTPQKNRIRDISNERFGSSSKGVKKLSFLASPPTTPSKPKNTSVYSKAKALFQRGNNCGNQHAPSHLYGRKEEGDYLNKFLMENIQNKTSNSLYLCGPPGTGKTAQVNVSFDYLKNEIAKPISEDVFKLNQQKVKIVKINCMSASKPESIFHEIYNGIDSGNLMSSNRKRNYDDLFQLLTKQNSEINSTILLLDEMDYLITKDQQVLFQLFNLASLNNSQSLTNKLILICISNALDLTDKFLPRLKRNCLNPQSLQFLPYTFDQIKLVITNKLKSLIEENKENESTNIPLIHPAAVLLCSKKSASITGDLRKAFDICYKSIEMVENDLRKNKSIKDINEFTYTTAPKVLISHVAKVCSNSFGDNSITKLKNLNLLQKAVLCCLFNYQINNMSLTSKKELNVNAFFDFYMKHSIEHIDKLLGKLKKGEFLEIISALESSSVIVLSDSKTVKKSNITSIDMGNKLIRANVPYDDLVKSIGDVGVLKRILHGTIAY